MVYTLTQRLASVYAPTGTVAFTIGPVLNQIAAEFPGYNRITVYPHYLDTPSPAFDVNCVTKNTPVFFTHADEISYDVKTMGSGEVPLTPLCAHRQQPNMQFPGVVLRYKDTKGEQILEQIAEGFVQTKPDSTVIFTTQHGSEGKIKAGDRVVFNPEQRLALATDGDTMTGIIDNRAGMAIALAVIQVLANPDQKINHLRETAATFIATDGEEGVADPPVFAWGAREVALALREKYADQSPMIVTDGHDFNRDSIIPPQALIARVVSNGKGPVIQPDRLHRVRLLVEAIETITGQQMAAETDTVGGTTSRSDDEGLRRGGIAGRLIYPIGYGVKAAHHDDGEPAAASLNNLVTTARFLTLAVYAANKGLLY